MVGKLSESFVDYYKFESKDVFYHRLNYYYIVPQDKFWFAGQICMMLFIPVAKLVVHATLEEVTAIGM